MTTAVLLWLLWQQTSVFDPTIHWHNAYHVYGFHGSRSACQDALQDKLTTAPDDTRWACVPLGVRPQDLGKALWQPVHED